MSKHAVAVDLAAQLLDAEAAIEMAIGKSAKFLEALMCSRSQLELSAVSDEGGVQKVTSTLAMLGQARTDLVAAHVRLDRARDKAGMPELAGGGYKPPPDAMPDVMPLSGSEKQLVHS